MKVICSRCDADISGGSEGCRDLNCPTLDNLVGVAEKFANLEAQIKRFDSLVEESRARRGHLQGELARLEMAIVSKEKILKELKRKLNQF